MAEVYHTLAIDSNTGSEQQAGLSREGKREFDKSGGERKGILPGETEQGLHIINLPKIQPVPWINTVIRSGHCLLSQHYQNMTTQEHEQHSAPD